MRTVRTPWRSRSARRLSVMRQILSRRSHPDRHRLQGVREVGADPLRRPGRLDGPKPGQELLEHDFDLELGEVRAEAEVRAAAAEADVVVRAPADVEPVRVVEDELVA